MSQGDEWWCEHGSDGIRKEHKRFFNRFLHYKTDEKLKEEISKLYKKFASYIADEKGKSLINHVLDYTPQMPPTAVDAGCMILVGLTGKDMIAYKQYVTGSLQDIRERKGLSQSQLAELSNVSIRTIQNYEQGTRDINKAPGKILNSLAKALDCRIEDLIVEKK